MKVEFFKEENEFPMFKLTNKQVTIEVEAHILLAACIVSMGLDYIETLILANSIVADSLFGQNFPDNYTEMYDNNDPHKGKQMEQLLTKLNKFLMDNNP